MIHIRPDREFSIGYNPITTIDEKEDNTMMDFGILLMNKGMVETSSEGKERAYLLLKGEVVLNWEGNKVTVRRDSFFDENPWCLHVPKDVEVSIECLRDGTEIAITKTYNDKIFTPKLYTKEECRSELRGEGTMGETSTRIVRTIFDITNSGDSNLVLGEVINFPGRWSSYPPHHHPQPEIYFYRFNPENGYGFAQLGEDVVMVKNNDNIKILNDASHPQVTAPGYAMFYIWAIRHLDGNPYIIPTFEPEHLWVTDKNAKFWPDSK